MSEQRASKELCLRAQLHPGLLFAAEGLCITEMTDGFCHPRHNGQCKCWVAAEHAMKALGLSAQAVHYIAKHRSQIEVEAALWMKSK